MTGKPSRIRERDRNRNQQMPTRPLTLKTEISAFPQLEEIALTLSINVQYLRKEASFVNWLQILVNPDLSQQTLMEHEIMGSPCQYE